MPAKSCLKEKFAWTRIYRSSSHRDASESGPVCIENINKRRSVPKITTCQQIWVTRSSQYKIRKGKNGSDTLGEIANRLGNWVTNQWPLVTNRDECLFYSIDVFLRGDDRRQVLCGSATKTSSCTNLASGYYTTVDKIHFRHFIKTFY